jgi:hypothetical protein
VSIRRTGLRDGTPLTTLVQLNPIYVTFNPSETVLAEIQKARAVGKVEPQLHFVMCCQSIGV